MVGRRKYIRGYLRLEFEGVRSMMPIESINFDELARKWSVHKQSEEKWKKYWVKKIPLDIFNGMNSIFQKQDFKNLITESKPKSELMTRKCVGNDGYVAVVLSSLEKHNRIAIVKDESAARLLYRLKGFEPTNLGFIEVLASVLFFTLFGPWLGGSIGYCMADLAGAMHESAKPYVLAGGKTGLGLGLLSGFAIPLLYSALKNRRFNRFQEQLASKLYVGREAIDFVLSVKDGNYEAVLAHQQENGDHSPGMELLLHRRVGVEDMVTQVSRLDLIDHQVLSTL